MRQPKKLYTSRTVWYNIAFAATVMATQFIPVLDTLTPETQQALLPFLVSLQAGGNVLMRIITREPVSL